MCINHIKEVYNQDRQHPELPVLITRDTVATKRAREVLRKQISELVTEANSLRVRKNSLMSINENYVRMMNRKRKSIWRTIGNLQVAFHRLKLRSQGRQLELF